MCPIATPTTAMINAVSEFCLPIIKYVILGNGLKFQPFMKSEKAPDVGAAAGTPPPINSTRRRRR